MASLNSDMYTVVLLTEKPRGKYRRSGAPVAAKVSKVPDYLKMSILYCERCSWPGDDSPGKNSAYVLHGAIL